MNLAPEKVETAWWKANLDNNENWFTYLDQLEHQVNGPLQAYQVYHELNQITKDQSIFSIDVGDVNQLSNRHLRLKTSNRYFTSNLFATMGVGIPGAIAAKLNYPDRQVFSLSVDGGAAMVMQDLVTQVQYHLPIINVIFSNGHFGFIRDEQEDTNEGEIGVEFNDIDFSKIADGIGMQGIRVTEISQLTDAFKQAQKIGQHDPVLIDVKITNERPIPVEAMKLDPARFDAKTINEFKQRYHAEDLKPFAEYLKQYGVNSNNKDLGQGGF